MPADWSQTATNIVVSKYFYGKIGSPERETSVRQLVGRVVDTIADWGAEQRYFKTPEDAENFRDELAHLMLTQKACFNSPVWFNVGVKEAARLRLVLRRSHRRRSRNSNPANPRPQCSACFINSVGDTLESILDLAKTEGMLFKWGSGTGTNLSTLREEEGLLSGGGRASGPLSFMKGFDAFAGVIKSGGKTRRAAKMVILNADHPDIEEFIWCKAKEEKKAHTLIDAGYDSSLDGEAYSSIFFQNANNSVRATDEFMEAVDQRRRLVDQIAPRQPAREALQGPRPDAPDRRSHAPVRRSRHAVRHHHQPLAHFQEHGAHQCVESVLGIHVPGRFGLQPGVAEPDEVREGRTAQFDVEAYRHAVDTVIMAQEIIVDNAAYPTEKIAKNSHDFRPLGLGYANLGALLMSMGIPYDSDQGRDWAAALTAIMCGQAYLTSARIAADSTGPCEGYAVNEEPFLDVIRMHRDATSRIDSHRVPAGGLRKRAQVLGRGLRCWAASPASATRRPRCSRPPAPSAS